MGSKSQVIWSLKEITNLLRERQLNEYDVNIGVSGKRGDGKSTFLFKIFNSFKKMGFNPEKHQVYEQEHVMNLLSNEKYGFCWDDEAINSGYKRDFQNTGQKELIKMVTNYRDNFNIYGSALPFFYSLDKDLRELIFMHVHIVERGVGIILLPLTDQIHESDPWDTKNNIRIEQQERARIKRNPNLPFRYQRLTTFAGYVYFGPMTEKQKRKYKDIKSRKRAKRFEKVDEKKELGVSEKCYELLKAGRLTKDGLMQICLASGEKYTSVVAGINRRLRDEGSLRSLSQLWKIHNLEPLHSKSRDQINNLVPAP